MSQVSTLKFCWGVDPLVEPQPLRPVAAASSQLNHTHRFNTPDGPFVSTTSSTMRYTQGKRAHFANPRPPSHLRNTIFNTNDLLPKARMRVQNVSLPDIASLVIEDVRGTSQNDISMSDPQPSCEATTTINVWSTRRPSSLVSLRKSVMIHQAWQVERGSGVGRPRL